MKRLLVFFIFHLAFFIFSRPVLAQTSQVLPSGQTIDSDYIRTGETIQIDGDIRGDAFLAGGLVTVNGKVDGDLFVAGGKVNINGETGGSVRVLGGDVTVNGPVGRNVLVLCGNCHVATGAVISGSLLSAGGNLEVSASRIGRGFRFFGSRLYLNSEINNEAFVVADREFLLGPRASISGSLKYTGSSEVVLEPGATVAGNIAYEKTTREETYPRFFGARGLFSLYQRFKPLADLLGLLVSVLVGYIFLGLFPRIFEKVAVTIERRPVASLGWGVIISLMTPLVIVLFAITIVGLPVSLVLVLVAYLFWVAASYLTAFFLGRKILREKFGERRGWALLLGLFLIYLLGLIPVLGTLVKVLLTLFALGAMTLSYRQPAIVEERAPATRAPRRVGRPRRI